jgi:hypothetical protein
MSFNSLLSNPPITIAHPLLHSKSHAGIIGNEHADVLAKSQPPPTLTLQTPPSKQQALRVIPSTTSTGLQKKK